MSDPPTFGTSHDGSDIEPVRQLVEFRTIRSEDLLRGAREVLIQHGQEVYRLRVTKAGKLILNK